MPHGSLNKLKYVQNASRIELITRILWRLAAVLGTLILFVHVDDCLSCACRLLKSLNDSISVQPAATCSSPQGSSWTRMIVVPLPWLRQQLGTHCRMNCETRISTVPPSDATWRRFCFNNTGCIERIRGAVRLCAIYSYIYINYITLHYIAVTLSRYV